jgi:four helix bundle protein
MDRAFTFPFQNLDVYRLARSVCRQVRSMAWPAGSAHLKDQATRAADSMVLNIAEGWGRGWRTKAGRNHFRIAKGSAGEVFAVLDILELDGRLVDELQRVGAMLGRLTG